jgi:hypothetical protein
LDRFYGLNQRDNCLRFVLNSTYPARWENRDVTRVNNDRHDSVRSFV